MIQDAERLRSEFDRIAHLSAERFERDRYQDWLLRHVPRPCGRALDVGCGAGTLACSLACRAMHVVAIDLSPAMVRVARDRSARHANIEFLVGDFRSLDLGAGGFDCIAAVAVLHHMSWIQAVERMKALLRPGGVLLIVDLFRDDGPADRLLSALAFAVRSVGDLGHRRPRELRDAWDEHGRGDSYLTLREARNQCRQALPGARFRRHLFWRYSVVWTKPGE